MVLKDLGIFLCCPPTIWCDNLSALALASNPVFHARTKHIEVDYHFIWEKVVNEDIQLHHISTNDQLADILTKALSSPRFLFLRTKLMPRYTSHVFEGGWKQNQSLHSFHFVEDHNSSYTAHIQLSIVDLIFQVISLIQSLLEGSQCILKNLEVSNRARAANHLKNLLAWFTESIIINHWLLESKKCINTYAVV